MTLKQVLRLFELSPAIYFEQCRKNKAWGGAVEQICRHSYEDAAEILTRLIKREFEKHRKHHPRRYYVEAVRKELWLLEHERSKAASTFINETEAPRGGVSSIADILKNLKGVPR